MYLESVIASVGHQDLILRIASDIPRIEELPVSTSLLTKLQDEFTIQGENLRQFHINIWSGLGVRDLKIESLTNLHPVVILVCDHQPPHTVHAH